MNIALFDRPVVTSGRTSLKAACLVGSLSIGWMVASAALAQDGLPPPKYSAVDANGVDLISGVATFTQPINSIGPAGSGLEVSYLLRPGTPISSLNSYVRLSRAANGDVFTVLVLSGASQEFRNAPDQGATPVDGSTGSFSIVGAEIVYQAVDGAVARFRFVQLGPTQTQATGEIHSISYPSGETLTFTRANTGTPQASLMVESSLGYALVGSNYGGGFDAVAANLKQGGCSATGCAGPTYANLLAQGRALVGVTSTNPATLTLSNPAGGADRVYTGQTLTNGAEQYTFYNGVSTWTYYATKVIDDTDSTPFDGIRTRTVTDPFGHTRIVKSRINSQHIISDTDAYGRSRTYQYTADAYGLGRGTLYQITEPEGNRTLYEFDGFRNVTAEWRYPKTGSTASPTVVRAAYSCHGAVCNKPDWVQDARGNQTDYTYDPVHGGVLTITKPAGPNGIRPQVRNTYGQFTARYVRDGVMQAAAAPVWRLTQTSTCMTGTAPTCIGTADEVVTTYTYEPSNAPNNVRLLSVTTRAGNVAPSAGAITAYTYNDRGDVIAVDGPLPGPADTTRYYYDASRWKTGEIGPDPDGSDVLHYGAARTTYAADGRVTLTETGMASSQTDGGMDGFVPLTFTRRSYGPTGLLTKVEEGQP